jgi:hypothetical protein
MAMPAEAAQRSTRLHLTEEQQLKGIKLNISLDCVWPDVTAEDQIKAQLQILSDTRELWEQQMKNQGRAIIETPGQSGGKGTE